MARKLNSTQQSGIDRFNYGGFILARQEILQDLQAKSGGDPRLVDRYMQGMEYTQGLHGMGPGETDTEEFHRFQKQEAARARAREKYPAMAGQAGQQWPYDHSEKHRQAALKGHGK